MPDDRNEWLDQLVRNEIALPPLPPPVACRKCLRPLPADKRGFGTCFPCGMQHPATPERITAATIAAAGTLAWTFLIGTKFETYPANHLDDYVTAIAAAWSLAAEDAAPEFFNGHEENVVVPIPSSAGLMTRVLAAHANRDGWPEIVVVDALQAAVDRPKQTGLDEAHRRDAARDKYTCSDVVAGKRVLVTDDVYTSGHTLHDAVRAVAEVGATSVKAAVYARRVYPDAMALYREESA